MAVNTINIAIELRRTWSPRGRNKLIHNTILGYNGSSYVPISIEASFLGLGLLILALCLWNAEYASDESRIPPGMDPHILCVYALQKTEMRQ